MMRYLVACIFPAVVALHPRPEYNATASYARWLVHESDYAVVATHHDGDGVFGNIVSISDGNGYEDSTGIVYTYIPGLDATYKDLMRDDRVTLTFSEMALANGTSGGCKDATAEMPTCGRLTITGRLTKVPEEHKAIALRYLFARHPVMKGWSGAHIFEPFWMAPENTTDFFVINMFGGAVPITRDEYLEAQWYRHDLPTGDSFVCSSCGHVYEADKDGGGKAFEDLPDDWACPICHAPKKSYHKVSRPGHNDIWVHTHGKDAVHI